MAGVGELEEMIARLHQDAQLDSAGKFTLDLSKSLQKLSQLARTYGNRWALYATQSGVAGGANQMHISSGLRSESVTLRFRGDLPESLRDPNRFTHFDNQASDDAPETLLLRQAVQWALAPGSSVNLVVEGPRGGFCLSGHDQNYQIHDLPAAEASRVALVRGRPQESWWQNPFRRARNSLALLLECRWRLSFCPVPIKFDGLSLCSGMPYDLPGMPSVILMEQLLLESDPLAACLAASHPGDIPAMHYLVGEQVERRPQWATPPAQLGWMEMIHPTRSGMLCLQDGPPAPGGFTVGSWWSAQGEPQHLSLNFQDCVMDVYDSRRCRCANALFYARPGRDLLYFQRYGMLCNPLDLRNLQTDAWTVIVADDSIHMDPTGLSPIRDEYVLRRSDELEESIRKTQIRLARRLDAQGLPFRAF